MLTVLYVFILVTEYPFSVRAFWSSVEALAEEGYSTVALPPGTIGSSAPITLPVACRDRVARQGAVKTLYAKSREITELQDKE
jgi:hypothetical protein